MQELLSSLIGVPATILMAAGLGIIAVTVVSRLRRRSTRAPIRWAHLVLGVALTGVGTLLLRLDIAVVPAH